MGAGGPQPRKVAFYNRFCSTLDQYDSIVLVQADNVGAKQMAHIRRALRAVNSELVMGKNTLIRKAIRAKMADNPALEILLTEVKGNKGFLFTSADKFDTIKEILIEHRVAAAAKPGVPAPLDVVIPAGNTGLDPSQTSFMQALNIATKINKGAVEIIAETKLITKGDKVGASQAALLTKLGIKPFSYGLEMDMIYENGDLYAAAVLDLDDSTILSGFAAGCAQIAAVSLGANYPTIASFPHSVLAAYKNVQAIGFATDYTFEQIKETKELLDNPEALAALAASAAPAAASAAPADAKGGSKEEESDEESEEDMGGFGLFD